MYAIPSYEDISVILPQYYRTPVLLDTTVTLNTDFFPWVSYGYFAGDYPAGITTLEGVPTDASITILTRAHGMRWDAMPVRRVKSGEDGIWRAEGIDPGLRYRVMGDKEGYNSVVADNVEPMNLPRFLPDRYEITVAKPFELELRIVGGIGDITLTHISGMLPQGVTLTDGVLHSEWPTGEVGDYPIEFELVDDAQQTNIATVTLGLNILPISFSRALNLQVSVGLPMAPFVMRISGGEPPYIVTFTGDTPDGLTISHNGDEITLSGTPEGLGKYSVGVKAVDYRGAEKEIFGEIAVASGYSYKYWRINIASNNGGVYTAIAELELRENIGGASIAIGGVASASSFANPENMPELAFDGDNFTKWTASGTSGWIQYDLGSPMFVSEVAVMGQYIIGDQSNLAIKDFTIEASNDGASWDVLKIITGETNWMPAEVRSWVFS